MLIEGSRSDSDSDQLVEVAGSVVVDLRVWGKERGLGQCYPLICHLLDTAAVMRFLWRTVVAEGFREKVTTSLELSMEETGRLVEFWAGLHDIGKLTPQFQAQVQVPEGYPASSGEHAPGHDKAAHLWLVSALDEAGYPEGKPSLSRLVAELIGGHHGCFHVVDRRHTRRESLPYVGLGTGRWEEQRGAAMGALAALVQPPTPEASLDRVLAAPLTGLVILADWLASQTPYIRGRLRDLPREGTLPELRRFFDGSLAAAPSIIEKAGLARLRLKPGSFAEEFPRFAPNSLQASLARELPELVTGPGLLMVAAPTGFGKTETALHAARLLGEATGTAGIYVALPTTATADQMFRRVAGYLARRADGPVSQTLLHGMAWLSPAEEMITKAKVAEDVAGNGETQARFSEWMRGMKRGLLAAVGVGTIDQALLSVLPVRHNALRLFALAGKTVVIDEVHAFSPYMRGLLRTLLRWLGELGVPVVLLSATLPAHVAAELAAAYQGQQQVGGLPDPVVPYPGWTYVSRDAAPVSRTVLFPREQRRTLRVDLRPVALTEKGNPDRLPVLVEELAPLFKNGGCAAVICTTVAEAQQTWKALTAWCDNSEHEVKPRVELLHSRFPAWQREEITQRVMSDFGKEGNRPSTIVVATQVIEQSLDIDLDIMISDLAPVELLLQRAGRLQRHPVLDARRPAWAAPRDGRRRMVVLTAPENDLTRLPRRWTTIYPQAALIRADRLLRERASAGIRIPEDVQELVDCGNPGDFPADQDPLLVGFEKAEVERSAEVMVELQTAHNRQIPGPREFRSLSTLSEHALNEEALTTRFNADSVRVLPCFELSEGEIRIGSPTGEPLPLPDATGRLSRDDLVAIMRHTIPVPGGLVRGYGDNHRLPAPWKDIWPLGDLVLLRHGVDTAGNALPVQVGRQTLLLDEELGLVEVHKLEDW